MNPKQIGVNAAKALSHWGDNAPAWVVMLGDMCDRTSQKKAAKEIRYSPAVVNQVIANAYTGDLTAVQRAVEGAFMNAETECPVLGTIPAHECIRHQRQKLIGSNAQRVRLWRACRNGCAHFRGQRGSE